MKMILRFLALFLFLLVCTIALVNISNTITIETSFLSLKVNIGFLILLSAISSSLGTLFLSGSFNNKNKLKKQIESGKLSYEIESEKVKQLQSKINTLEEALKIATNK